MARRSYHQYCGLAVALDLVAERWALLIVRDLEPGPRRFTDLFAGLPGIATDVLADRLRSLEAAGVLTLTQIRHPVPARVYELTERGRELAAVAGQLARWGMDLLPRVGVGAADYTMNPRWALQSVARRYTGGLRDGAYRFRIDEEELTVVVSGSRASLRYGHVGEPVRLELACSARAFLAMVKRPPEPGAELPRGVDRNARPEGVVAFFAAMPIGMTAAGAPS